MKGRSTRGEYRKRQKTVMKSKWQDTFLSLKCKKKMREWVNRKRTSEVKEKDLKETHKRWLWSFKIFFVKLEIRVTGVKEGLGTWYVWEIVRRVYEKYAEMHHS